MEPIFKTPELEKLTFAGCELDPMFQTLHTPSQVMRLRGKLFAVIYCLVSNQDKLVTRRQLIEECWLGNPYTGEQAVTHSICHIRRILKNHNIHASITTLSKQGYIFSCGEKQMFLDASKSQLKQIRA